jgi:hypothetical protein
MVRHGQSIHGYHGSTESKSASTVLTDLPRERARFSIEGVGRNAGLLVVNSATTVTFRTSGSTNTEHASANFSLFNRSFDTRHATKDLVKLKPYEV